MRLKNQYCFVSLFISSLEELTDVLLCRASSCFHIAINSLWVHSLLPLLLFLFDIWLLPEEREDVEVFTTDAILVTATCSWFCTILLEFSSMFLCKISFSSSSNARLPFSILKENKALYLESANGRSSVKKMFFFVTSPWCGHWLTCFARKGYSHKRLIFFPDYFTRDENGRSSFSREFSCSSTINEFRTGTLCRILTYSTEHL